MLSSAPWTIWPASRFHKRYRAKPREVFVQTRNTQTPVLLDVDHTRQTSRFGGRDMRLTDVHGEVMRDVLA